MKWVLYSLQEVIDLRDVGVYRAMICDNAKRSVNRSWSACCHIRNSGYTGYDSRK